MENKPSLYTKVPIGGNKEKIPARTTCINISIRRIFTHKKQEDVQKTREKMCKNRGKARRILQSKKGIYPLFGKKRRIEVTKLTCLTH